MNILITGAAGFIGFHTAKTLASLNHRVIGIDSYTPYYDLSLKKNRTDILTQHGVHVIHASIEEGDIIQQLIKQHNISHIVHLAAQAGVRYSLDNPFAYLRSNIDGFVKMLEAVRANPEVRMVWASSSSVYGNNSKLPFCETDPTDHPQNLYGASKKSNEVMAYSYRHLFNLELIGLRFFTVYGPWGRPDMAYYSFAQKMAQQQPITIFGNGTLRRDFTYIDDIVSGIIAALTSQTSYGIYNLGRGQPETVSSLIHHLEEALGQQAIIEHADRHSGDMVETFADISLASNDLGFAPKTSLRDGIHHFAQWFSSYHKKASPLTQ